MMSSLERDYIDKEPTETTFAEEEVIEDVLEIYEGDKGRSVRVGRAMHKSFLTNGLTNLPAQVGYLDASRPWLSYWMLNSMDLIGHLHTTPPNTLIPTPQAVVAFMRSCFTEVSPGCGSFGGGPAQIPHLAPTYSGVLTLLAVGTSEAYALLDEKKEMIKAWFKTLKNPDGSVLMHDGGEVDVRGCYCMLIVAVMVGIDTPDVTSNIAEFVASCQTYEGGFGCKPSEEAHGGFTFCATAALGLVRRLDLINVPRLKKWLATRQHKAGLGFNGRTNKLIDSCYSFWVGSAHAILRAQEAVAASRRRCVAAGDTPPRDTAVPSLPHLASMADALVLDQMAYIDLEDLPEELLQRFIDNAPKEETVETKIDSEPPTTHQDVEEDWVESDSGMFCYNQEKLQQFLICCCQQPAGGLRDKPGVRPDYYHTCYALSGLGLSQNLGKAYHVARLGGASVLSNTTDAPPPSTAPDAQQALLLRALEAAGHDCDPVFYKDDEKNVLRHSNPMFNLRRERVVKGLKHFRSSSVIPLRR